MKYLQLFLRYPLLGIIIIFLGKGTSFAQEPIGGPYTVDANTVLLLHFDDNLNNSSPLSDNGVGHGTYYYLPSPLGTGMGKCLRFKNDALSDSSYVTVADNPNLDLTGDWTIEGWINVFTFGTTSGDHRWVPRLCIKPGDEIFWRPNWWVELWGDARRFQTGFHTADQQNWPAVNSANNVMVPGQWVHLAFIRDDSRKILIQMVHNASRQLIWFGTMSYADLPVTTPLTNNQAVHIGFAGGGGDSWLDGFVDEVRVSNIVRNFPVPPIITEVTELPNQPDYVPSYQVKAKMMAFAPTGFITTALIHYSTDNGTTWQTTPMSLSGDYHIGNIPQFPFGTVIKYYVSATDNYGSTSTHPPIGVPYLSFGVYMPNTLTLYLAFEETSGTPIDSSSYHNPITIPNYAPVYSTDARFGVRSVYFNRDSTHLEVWTPFINAEQFSVNFWFKADTLIHGTRILNKAGADDWYHNNYEIGLRLVGGVFRASARYWRDASDTQFELRLDNAAVAPRAWYHVIFERDATVAAFEIRDENDQRLQWLSAPSERPRMGVGALRIGKASSAGQPWSYIPHFFGKIDELKIYNYPASGIVSVEGPNVNELPQEIQLLQSYPNPFNPKTVINFSIPKAERVIIAVYDMLGRKIKTLLDEQLYVGRHSVSWDGRNDNGKIVSSGVYLYRLDAGNTSLTKKMLLMK